MFKPVLKYLFILTVLFMNCLSISFAYKMQKVEECASTITINIPEQAVLLTEQIKPGELIQNLNQAHKHQYNTFVDLFIEAEDDCYCLTVKKHIKYIEFSTQTLNCNTPDFNSYKQVLNYSKSCYFTVPTISKNITLQTFRI